MNNTSQALSTAQVPKQSRAREESYRVYVEALLNERDVARITGMAVASVRRWRLQQRGPIYRKCGASVKYRAQDVDDFIASLRPEQLPEERLGMRLDITGRTVLAYETVPDDEKKLKSFEHMLESLGIQGESIRLVGEDKEIITALDRTLKRAPKPRSPFD